MKKLIIPNDVVFLSGNGNHALGADILVHLSELFGKRCVFEHINYNKWPELELDNRIPSYAKMKNKVVVIYQSLFRSDLVEEAEDLIWACKHQYGAQYIIGIFPFMWNRRQDPKMFAKEGDLGKKIAKPDEIQRLRMTISKLAFCGVDEMLVATPHSNMMSEYCKEYGVVFNEINPSPLFAKTMDTFVRDDEKNLVKVYSPDLGSIQRAIELGSLLKCPVLFNEKNRAINSETTIIESEAEEIKNLVMKLREAYNFPEIHYATSEMVKDQIVAMIEDEVASGGTANGTGRRLADFGVKSSYLLATHPVLTLSWRNKLFFNDPFTKVIMANSIPRNYEKRTGGKIFDISLGSLFASDLFRALNRL